MKRININYLSLLLLPAILALFAVSCKKEQTLGKFSPSRFFTPTSIMSTRTDTTVTLSWNPTLFPGDNKVTYTIQISKDSSFQTGDTLSFQVDTSLITLTDDTLQVRQNYFARVKANAAGSSSESYWKHSSRFSIIGVQLMYPERSADVTDQSAIVRWHSSPELTKIVVTDTTTKDTMQVPVESNDITANNKKLTNLKPNTVYQAEIYKGNASKGYVIFKTEPLIKYSVTLNPGDDIQAAVDAAADGAVIGLKPGEYDMSSTNIKVDSKKVTIRSTSNNAGDTKVDFKEIDLSGDGAALKLDGIEFDGTSGGASYFINLESGAAAFGNVDVENCVIHYTKNCLVRGNRGSNNQSLDTLTFNNCIAYDNGNGSYHYLMIDKLDFKRIALTNSTFYNGARALISWAKDLSPAQTPEILINHCTINNFGFSGRDYFILDASDNKINFMMENSIIANTPKPGETLGDQLFRADETASSFSFINNDYFNLNGGDPQGPVSIPDYVTTANNQTLDLGWTASTTDFSLPMDSPLRTTSTTRGAIGDPRWLY